MVPSARLLWFAFAGLAVAALPVLVDSALWPLVLGTWGVIVLGGVTDAIVLMRARPSLDVQVPAAVGFGAALEPQVKVSVRAPKRLFATLRGDVDAPLEPSDEVATRTGGHGLHKARPHTPLTLPTQRPVKL